MSKILLGKPPVYITRWIAKQAQLKRDTTIFYTQDGKVEVRIYGTLSANDIPCDKSSLYGIEIGAGVTDLAGNAFRGFSRLRLVDMNRADNLTSIGTACFESCSDILELTIPDTVTSINSYAFNQCDHLRSVRLPTGITRIYGSMLRGCRALTSVEIPYGVTKIDGDVFNDCQKLNVVYIPDTVTKIDNKAFLGCAKLNTIYVDSESRIETVKNMAVSVGAPADVEVIVKTESQVLPVWGKGVWTLSYEWARESSSDFYPRTLKFSDFAENGMTFVWQQHYHTESASCYHLENDI